MPDYSKTKIYTIVCWTTGKIYIGHTTQSFLKRLSNHKCTHRSMVLVVHLKF